MKQIRPEQAAWVKRRYGIRLDNTRGMNSRCRKLDENQVREIRAMIARKLGNLEIVAQVKSRFGIKISATCVSLIRRRHNWWHLV